MTHHRRYLVPLLLAASCTLVVATETKPVRVFLDPLPGDLVPGQQRRIAVRVEGIPTSGLAAFQFELRYDPDKIRLLDPNAGFVASGVPAFAPLGGSPLCSVIRGTSRCPDPEWMLTSTERNPVGTFTSNAEQGVLTIAYGTSGETAPPVGGGVLAVIEIAAMVKGRVGVTIADAILADASDPPRRYDFTVRAAARKR